MNYGIPRDEEAQCKTEQDEFRIAMKEGCQWLELLSRAYLIEFMNDFTKICYGHQECQLPVDVFRRFAEGKTRNMCPKTNIASGFVDRDCCDFGEKNTLV